MLGVTPRAYYNEIEPFAVEWLHNLMLAGLIMDGEVDSRSIVEVKPDDLKGFTRCHFFAGVGGWDLALRLADWPAERPIWTGSCPCQPFSAAGKQQGHADERHLWPEWYRLIRESHPLVVFGEQVETAINHGWLDLVCADLEREGYAVGTVGLPAASVGAPHIRPRLWFVADANGGNAGAEGLQRGRKHGQQPQDCGAGQRMADAVPAGRPERRAGAGNGQVARSGGAGVLGDADDARSQGRRQRRDSADQRTAGATSVDGFWSDAEWIACRDGKVRPVEPGSFPLAHGISARVGKLRALGNAIVPQVGAEVIRAYMECRP